MRVCCCWITGRTYWQNDIPLKDGTTKTFKTVQIWMNLQSRKVYTFNTWHNNIPFCPQQNGIEKGMFLCLLHKFKNPHLQQNFFVRIFKVCLFVISTNLTKQIYLPSWHAYNVFKIKGITVEGFWDFMKKILGRDVFGPPTACQ